MIQVNRIYLIFNRLVTKKFLVDTSDFEYKYKDFCYNVQNQPLLSLTYKKFHVIQATNKYPLL